MNLKDRKIKTEEYEQRQRDWRDMAILQMSTANNILLTISSGFLVFLFDKTDVKNIHFSFTNISFSVTGYVISVLSLLLSILSGIVVLFSRLYDLRISRNIALTRRRELKNNNIIMKVSVINESPSFYQEILSLIRIVTGNFKLIDYYNIKGIDRKNNLETRVLELTKLSRLLSYCTWRWIWYQAFFFLINCISYSIYRLML